VGFDAGKIRKAELVTGGGGVLLLADLFLLPWLEVRGVSLDGWHVLTTSRWVLLVAVAAAFALVILTVLRRTPALPVLASMVTFLLGGLASLLLLYRIIHHPGFTACVGIYVGFVAALAIGYGGYLALRTERSSFGDPRSIETVPAGSSEPGSAGRAEPTSAGRPGP
jgi:hypothetical protein